MVAMQIFLTLTLLIHKEMIKKSNKKFDKNIIYLIKYNIK